MTEKFRLAFDWAICKVIRIVSSSFDAVIRKVSSSFDSVIRKFRQF